MRLRLAVFVRAKIRCLADEVVVDIGQHGSGVNGVAARFQRQDDGLDPARVRRNLPLLEDQLFMHAQAVLLDADRRGKTDG